jgi:hypothetical protein
MAPMKSSTDKRRMYTDTMLTPRSSALWIWRGETKAEQKREQRPELPVDEEGDERPRQGIERRRCQLVQSVIGQHHVRCQPDQVGQQHAVQSEAAQHVENRVPLGFYGRLQGRHVIRRSSELLGVLEVQSAPPAPVPGFVR